MVKIKHFLISVRSMEMGVLSCYYLKNTFVEGDIGSTEMKYLCLLKA